MEDLSEDDLKQKTEMETAVGQSLLAWAQAEMQLNLLFITLVGIHQEKLANSIWGQLKSFDARMSILDDLFSLYSFKKPVINDGTLLLRWVRTCGKRRNQIAHATLLFEGKSGVRLQPFYVFGAKRDRLTIKDVQQRKNEFIELTTALGWFNFTRLQYEGVKPLSTLPSSWKRLPDLMKALRAQQSQNRRGQRELQRDLRQVRLLRRKRKQKRPARRA